jgi:uncharacterized membrane protein YuzA (DUF378 family)
MPEDQGTTAAGRGAVTIPIPSHTAFKWVALGCFALDVIAALAGWGTRLHFVSLGLAAWMLNDLL